MIFSRIPLSNTDDNVYLDAYVADRVDGFTRKAIVVPTATDRMSTAEINKAMPFLFNFLNINKHPSLLKFQETHKGHTRISYVKVSDSCMPLRHF